MALYLGNEKIAGSGSTVSITPENIGAAKDDLSNIDSTVALEVLKQIGLVEKPEIVETILSASGWNNNTYSFESSYPHSSYDIEIFLSPSATSSQVEAFTGAIIVGSPMNNVLTALGTVPTVDIPVYGKVMAK